MHAPRALAQFLEGPEDEEDLLPPLLNHSFERNGAIESGKEWKRLLHTAIKVGEVGGGGPAPDIMIYADGAPFFPSSRRLLPKRGEKLSSRSNA